MFDQKKQNFFMSEIIHLVTEEGCTLSCEFNSIEDISQTFTFFDMESPNDVDYWRSFFEDYAQAITEHLLEHVTTVKLSVSCNGNYEIMDTGAVSDSMSMNSKFPATVTRHTVDVANKVQNQFLAVHDPNIYYHRLQEQFGSNIGHLKNYNTFTMSFMFPWEFNVRSLPTSFRLHKCELTGNLDYLPYNSDDYCILHCIFAGKDKILAGKSLNANKIYIKAFNEWFNENNLGDFYIDGYFNLDIVEQLEKRLDVNINFYTFEKNLELYYRSSYNQDHDMIFNLVTIPMLLFYDNNDKSLKNIPKNLERGIVPHHKLGQDFLAAINIKNVIKKREAHCALLSPGVFRKRRKEDNTIIYDDICRFCTGRFKSWNIKVHEDQCKNHFSDYSKRDRLRVYKDIRPGKDEKKFEKYVAKYRVPFVVYDFETRVENGRHVPLSYGILYLNVFDFKKSRRYRTSNHNSEELLESFIKDCVAVAEQHYKLQSVDFANAEEKNAAEHPQDGICPICLETKDEFEYNHSHFVGDNLNTHLNCYMCKNCNLALTIRNKPLKFYGHNSSRFDHNLFMEVLLNSDKFKNHKFLAKTESRFTQVECSLSKNADIKLSFNDSKMIVAGALGKLASAWITKDDSEKLKDLLKLFYPTGNLDELLEISSNKQIFPYNALSIEECFDQKIIEKEMFHDNLYNEDISDEDYSTYLDASSRLEKVIGEDYTFYDYHDFYLTLDCVLLAMVLFNFSKVCYDTNGICPLWSVSISSYSFCAMLHHNKYAEKNIPTIKIPTTKVQQVLQKSIKGGFSQIFHKQIPQFNKEKDFATGVDFNSLYPSAVATFKLPYEFTCQIKCDDKTTEELLKIMEAGVSYQNDTKYYFIEVDIAPLAEKYQQRVSTFPLFPENREVKPEYLSRDQLKRWSMNCSKPNKNGDIILKDFKGDVINCVTFFEKKNYVTSYSYMEEALKLGYEIEKIHNIYEFKADFVASDYITKIYQLKKEASIEKNNIIKEIASKKDEDVSELKNQLSAIESRIGAYKIMANGFFGSCIINVDRHSDTKMVNTANKKTIKNSISSLRFKSLYHAGNKTLINMMKSSYTLSYPLCLGSGILWESKNMMIRFVYALYDYLEKYELKLNSLLTDTDSYYFHIPDFFTEFKSIDEFTFKFNKEAYMVFDTSGNKTRYQMPETHEEFCFMKNETKNKSMTEFNGLCSKVYSKVVDGGESTKGKGVPQKLQKKHLSNELYRSIIDGTGLEEDHTCSYGNFSTKKLKIDNIKINKSYVTFVDIKSYYGENGILPIVFGSTQHLEIIKENLENNQ